MPVEIKRAKDIVAQRNDYMADAKQKADRLRQEAEDYAKELLNKDAITRGAEQKAADMIAEAEVQCQQLKEAASEYCEETLRRMEEAVADAYDEVKHSRAQFRSALSALTGTKHTVSSSSSRPQQAPNAPCTTPRPTRTNKRAHNTTKAARMGRFFERCGEECLRGEESIRCDILWVVDHQNIASLENGVPPGNDDLFAAPDQDHQAGAGVQGGQRAAGPIRTVTQSLFVKMDPGDPAAVLTAEDEYVPACQDGAAVGNELLPLAQQQDHQTVRGKGELSQGLSYPRVAGGEGRAEELNGDFIRVIW